MVLEKPAVVDNPVKAQEWFSPGNSCAKGAHILCLPDHLGRDIDGVLIGKNSIRSLPFNGKRAVPAGAVAPSRNEEDHLCARMAENTSF
jgi:hypothetical protein